MSLDTLGHAIVCYRNEQRLKLFFYFRRKKDRVIIIRTLPCERPDLNLTDISHELGTEDVGLGLALGPLFSVLYIPYHLT